jgi:hypothetical protein
VLGDGSVYSVDSGDQATTSSWTSGEEVAANEGAESLTNLENGEKVSAKHVGAITDANPYPGTGDHTQETNSDDGKIIVLDDGSIWAVPDASDQTTASIWTDATSITVNEESGGSGYELVNTDDHEIVHANYMGDE